MKHVVKSRWVERLAALVLAAPALFACESAAEPELLCNPGDNIFCRCEDNSAGTKKCAEDGMGTGECGNCQEPPATNHDDDNPDGPAPVPHGDGSTMLLSPCFSDGECQSGMCRSGFCTTPCETVSGCPYPASECVPFDDEQLCMPRCGEAADCSLYGAASQCGFAHASDSWRVSVCGHWGGQHQLMPVGAACAPFDHSACNLGYAGRQTVCSDAGECVTGCFYDTDCLGAAKCSQQGKLGTCQ